LEMRYGTLRIRIESARDRLKAWASGGGQSVIDELEDTEHSDDENESPVYPLWQDDFANLPPLVSTRSPFESIRGCTRNPSYNALWIE
jgi:hypothetical protein